MGKKLATRPLILSSLVVFETALAAHTTLVYKHLTIRLVMMEMRMLLGYFLWHFDAELVHPGEEPVYEDIFIGTRGPLDLCVSPVHSKT